MWSSIRTKGGKTLYRTSTLARNLEVIAVKPVAKPQDPEHAIRVNLRVSPADAARIERIKKRVVNVVQTGPGGKPQTKRKAVTLRLERSAPAKK